MDRKYKSIPHYQKRVRTGPDIPCALKGCEGTFKLRNKCSKQKFCTTACGRRQWRLRGKKTITITCGNEECGRVFPTLHPDERKHKKMTMHYDYCCLQCAREDEVGSEAFYTTEQRDANEAIKVISFATVLDTGAPLTAEALSKACDMFTDKKSVLSKKPPSKRFSRDELEHPYIKAIDLSQYADALGATTGQGTTRTIEDGVVKFSPDRWGPKSNG